MIRNSWKDKGISDDLMKSFWRRLWALDMPEKIKVWLWLLSHKSIPIEEWLSFRGGGTNVLMFLELYKGD